MNILNFGNKIGSNEHIDGKKITVYHKYSNEIIGEVYEASREEVKLAVKSAIETFDSIKLSPTERSQILMKTADTLHKSKEELAHLLSKEVGRTINDCLIEVERAINTFIISSEEAKRISGEGVPIEGQQGNENRMSFTIKTPVGVVAAITPFNMPLNLSAHKIGPAIAAGNTVVLKPSEAAPLTVMKVMGIMSEAGLPEGFINIVNGYGESTGQYLIENTDIDFFTFTGSAKVGEHIKKQTGIKKISLELGNNSPTIVHKDANDIKSIAKLAAQRGFMTANGQACIAVQRLYVHQEIYNKFLGYFVEETQKLKVGNPEKEETDVGVMISEKEAVRLESWVNEAISNGARLECGGQREGAIYKPTILTNVEHNMKVVCNEVFGPVVTVIPYKNIDGVFKLSNDSEYGLQAGLFTSSLDIAMRAVYELEFGGVIINDVPTFRTDAMPYGGIKNSGLGKEGPKFAIEEMTNEKTIVLNL